MMKKLKKLLCYIIPLVLVVVIALTFVPRTFAVENNEKPDKNFNTSSDFNGQVVYAAGDTGAHSAAKEYKGGAIFLEPNTSMTMAGGNITGHSNTYGGAIYISNGATFTMKGGTISGNSATYGGAIYVESGGKCIIEAGAIKENKANHGAAVYIEEGGEFSASPTAEVADNEIEDTNFSIKVSDGTILFGNYWAAAFDDRYLTQQLHYTFIGSFPQTYVSREYDAELYNALEQGYASGGINKVGSWNISSNVWDLYNYDGETYVRGECKPFEGGYNYKNREFVESVLAAPDSPASMSDIPKPEAYGELVVARTEWYKVEPVRWMVLNYDKWKAGEEDIELISEEILAAMPFSTRCQNMVWCDEVSAYNEYYQEFFGASDVLDGIPEIREWLNGEFYEKCFSGSEKISIMETQNPNSFDRFDDSFDSIYESENDPSTWSGDVSSDNIYLLTNYDINSKYTNSYFGHGNGVTMIDKIVMTTSPTDFAVANGIQIDTTSVWGLMRVTLSRYRIGTSPWWLRSTVGCADFELRYGGYMQVCSVGSVGAITNNGNYGYDATFPPDDILGVRPAMHLNIKP